MLLLAGAVLLPGCSAGGDYYHFEPLAEGGWSKNDAVTFTPALEDSLAAYDIYVAVRHNNDYRYRNLWLFIDYPDANGVMKTDTVNGILAQPNGEWRGAGWGSLYQLEFLYKKAFLFPAGKENRVIIRQGMRDDVLPGIREIGLKLKKTES